MRKIKLRKHRPRIFKVYPDKEIFNEWLQENIHRFNHKPVLQEKSEECFVYGFEGIIANISLKICFGYLAAELFFDMLSENYEGEDARLFDIEDIEYIGDEKYHPLKGYYDADNIEGDYYYFSTQKELYIHNVFETIIETTNKMFVSENSLYLIDYDGMTRGFVAPTTEDHSVTKDSYKAYIYDLFRK